MDYHKMSLVELKQAAKEHTPKIKQYYIKSRIELIQILSMTDFPTEMILEKKTISELRKEAQARKLPGIWKMRRSELMELLQIIPIYFLKNRNKQNVYWTSYFNFLKMRKDSLNDEYI
jgi:hypothetical protein